MRYRTCFLLALTVGCGESTLDRLCDADSGAYTLYSLAAASCTANPSPVFATAKYQEQNCRGTLDPELASDNVGIASDEVLARCKQALAANPCRPELYKDWYAATRICEDLLVGHVPTGVSCSVDDECGGASFCKHTGACGLCLVQNGEGAACAGANECQSRLCTQGQCRVTNVPSGGQCVDDAQCGTGLICRDGGHCEPLEGNLGSACATDADCNQYESSCVAQRCTALAPAGQACTPWTGGDGSKAHCRWFDQLGCIGGTCKDLPVGGAAAACGIDVARCGPDAWCTQAKCSVVVDEGEFCNSTAECGPYGVCIEHACSFSDFSPVCVLPVD